MMKDDGLSMELPRKSRRRLKQSTRMDEFVIMETVGARRDEMEDPESEDIDLDTHYRISIYNATLDQVIGEMNRRFSVESRSLMTAASACSPRSPSFLNCKVMEPLVEHYHLNREMVSFQAEAAARFLQKKEVKSLCEVVNHLLPVKEAFIDLLKVLQITLTLGVSTASCERSFSCLKRLKTHLRATIGQERLNSLALLAIERDLACKLDLEEAVDRFAAADKNRRIKLNK